VIDPADAGELVILVAVWVDPAASDETAVRAANRDAARRALDDAFEGDRGGRIDELLALRGSATNAFYSGR
jgi:formaldehyde-activating enzyme involved in methanogenesis